MSKESPVERVLIVFGKDEDGKIRAGYFESADADIARTAAEKLGFHSIAVDGTETTKIAEKLHAGDVHATGKMFLPVAQKKIYLALLGLAGLSEGAAIPTDWDTIKAGHVVVAHEGKSEGWWEAIVIKRDSDSVILRWRDYPKQSKVRRHRSQIALALV
jgi:hypothetical protein